VKFLPIEETLPVTLATSKYARKNAARAVKAAIELVAQKCTFTVPSYSLRELLHKAIDANRKRSGKQIWNDAPEEVLARIEVNYLRHEQSNYDSIRTALSGHVGAREGWLNLRFIILTRIADAYPHLANECMRQWQESLHAYFHYLPEQEFAEESSG
jgi:hypothetical protein